MRSMLSGSDPDSVRITNFNLYFRLLTALALGLLCGCANAPPALQISAISTSVTHYAGNPLSGPLAENVNAVSPPDALAVSVSFIALTKIPAGVYEPIG